MITSAFVLFEIVSIIADTTNGQPNPFFECRKANEKNMEVSDDTYTIAVNERDEVVVNDCAASTINEIVKRISRTSLRRRPLRLHMAAAVDAVNALDVTGDLDLSGNNLTEVDVRKFGRLKTLNLTSNRIQTLRSVQLRANTTLASLDVSRNRLFGFEHLYIPPTRRLYAHANNIFELGPNVTLPETLRLLDLTRNEIENVDGVRFRSKNLRVLNLSVNLINAVPDSIFRQLPALETLVLECNKIFDIEVGAFAGNAKLIELNLRDNNLSALKKGVFDDLVNLQALDISKNELLKVTPDAVQNLNNLIDFSVSENARLCDDECKHDMEFLLVLGGRLRALKMERLRLRQFPVTLTTSIRRLDLSNNELRTVQLGNLENFPFLQELTLSGNDIETTENDVFVRMEFLRELRLDSNRLKRVPQSLPQSLQLLHLHRNRISRIERNDFNGLINLRTLTLNSNLINSVESESFRQLENLETLDISDNPIVTLNTDAFEGPVKLKFFFASELKKVVVNATDLRYFPISEMPNLQTLNLSGSPEMVTSFLKDMPLLATVKQLEILDISVVNLTRIPTYLEDFVPRLRYLRSADNPLDCDDTWWQKWKRSNSIELRELLDDDFDLTVRVTRQPLNPLGDRHVFIDTSCPIPTVNFTYISSEEFWINEERASNVTTTTEYRQHEPQPTSTSVSTLAKDWLKSSRNLRTTPSIFTSNRLMSTLTPQISNSSSKSFLNVKGNQATGSPYRLTNNVTTIIEWKHMQYRTDLVTVSVTNPSRPVRMQNESNKSLITNNIDHTPPETSQLPLPTILPRMAIQHGIFSANATSSKPFIQWPPLPHHSNITLRLTKSHSSSILWPNFQHLSRLSPVDNDEPRILNRTTDNRISFFDWFPAFNETANLAERTAVLDDGYVEYTHPGLVIFSVIICLLIVVCLSLVARSCLHKYKWATHRYQITEFDNEYQRSIEINSVSAYMETELSSE